ncbi:unnamed protein product [Anisakis simplex]|uniref:Ovule protein n=1 Tax=Anisakis simplex TaxID=6269 RepID=A0A0M3K0M6_ANISI|nr:unnamed protein product [Anisakis simplex]
MVKKDRLPDRKTRRRSQHRMKKFQIKANASPLFQFYPKNETPNNEHEHQRSSIVAVSRSDSAAIPHADSYAPSVAGSNKGT